MSPELERSNARGVLYENEALGVKPSYHPLNRHFFEDGKEIPVSVDLGWKQVNALEVGFTTPVVVYNGIPIGGEGILVVERGSVYVQEVHESIVQRIGQ